jgi:hypothetical protein
MSLKKSSDTIGNRSRDLAVSSAVPQPLRHRVPRNCYKGFKNSYDGEGNLGEVPSMTWRAPKHTGKAAEQCSSRDNNKLYVVETTNTMH